MNIDVYKFTHNLLMIVFKRRLALPFKCCIILFTMSVSTVLLNKQLRSTSSTTAIVISCWTVVNMYMLMSFGYYFPGKVNTLSKSIIQVGSVCSGFSINARNKTNFVREVRAVIKSCRHVRVLIGSANFYERGNGTQYFELFINENNKTGFVVVTEKSGAYYITIMFYIG